jgi:hypothetical protein
MKFVPSWQGLKEEQTQRESADFPNSFTSILKVRLDKVRLGLVR